MRPWLRRQGGSRTRWTRPAGNKKFERSSVGCGGRESGARERGEREEKKTAKRKKTGKKNFFFSWTTLTTTRTLKLYLERQKK